MKPRRRVNTGRSERTVELTAPSSRPKPPAEKPAAFTSFTSPELAGYLKPENEISDLTELIKNSWVKAEKTAIVTTGHKPDAFGSIGVEEWLALAAKCNHNLAIPPYASLQPIPFPDVVIGMTELQKVGVLSIPLDNFVTLDFKYIAPSCCQVVVRDSISRTNNQLQLAVGKWNQAFAIGRVIKIYADGNAGYLYRITPNL